jgi:hypothetical protein
MNRLTDELHKLKFYDYELSLREKNIGGITTLNIDIRPTKDRPLRHLADIQDIIDKSSLAGRVKRKCMEIFKTIARAEAKVHGTTVEKVHFHEVGAVDTIIDVAGAVSLVDMLGPERIIASKINLGSGFVEFSHGRHQVPAPAVAELAKSMKTFSTDSGMELATPTGMAVVKNIADEFGDIPEGTIKSVGYGSGTRSSDKNPTYVRAYIIE